MRISIHAPARGATICRYFFLPRKADFNPRSREGSDIPDMVSFEPFGNFNPRSREGSDEEGHFLDRGERKISIHAPARGATRCRDFIPLFYAEFQSTLPRGERPRNGRQ